MVKNLLVVLLAVLVVSLSGGIAVNRHFCGGQQVEVAAKSCCSKNKACQKDCCKTELVKVFQLQDDYVVSNQVLNIVAVKHIVQPLFTTHQLSSLFTTITTNNVEPPPPKLLVQRLSLLQSYLC